VLTANEQRLKVAHFHSDMALTQTHSGPIKTEQGSSGRCRENWAALLCACLNSVLNGLSAKSTG